MAASVFLTIRLELACSLVRNGRVLEFQGSDSDESGLLLKVVGKLSSIPPICILHEERRYGDAVNRQPVFCCSCESEASECACQAERLIR